MNDIAGLAGAWILLPITFVAALVVGGLGYGFHSIVVPVALLAFTNKVLNPALVLVGLAVNGYNLFLNRRSVPFVWRRTLPLVWGLVPGVAAGALLLSVVHPGWITLFTYAALLPLILLQAGGVRRPVRSERTWWLPTGAGVGFLYATTTVSGPPLAVALNNQGLVKEEFRAAMTFVRFTESALTVGAYGLLGLLTRESASLLPFIIPSVVIGVPLGAVLANRVDAEVFRRISMSFDAWIVGLGLSKALGELRFLAYPANYGALVVAGTIDIGLLITFFSTHGRGREVAGADLS